MMDRATAVREGSARRRSESRYPDSAVGGGSFEEIEGTFPAMVRE